ncbi:hypothetical protein D3C76_1504990 [compost metagenome]
MAAIKLLLEGQNGRADRLPLPVTGDDAGDLGTTARQRQIRRSRYLTGKPFEDPRQGQRHKGHLHQQKHGQQQQDHPGRKLQAAQDLGQDIPDRTYPLRHHRGSHPASDSTRVRYLHPAW